MAEITSPTAVTVFCIFASSYGAIGCSGDDQESGGSICSPATPLVCQCGDGSVGTLPCDSDGNPVGICVCPFSGSGGTTATNSNAVTGGNTDASGTLATGGDTGASGSAANGGTVARDGAVATDGNVATGVNTGVDGAAASGGTAASGGSTGTSGTVATDDAPVETGESSAGCGMSPPANGEHILTVGGVQRRYLLNVPSGYDSMRAYPLVFGFHGATSSAERFQSNYYGGLDSAIGSDAVIVYGQAQGAEGATRWDNQGQTDLDYFDAVLSEVLGGLCIDTGRVFATGHSSGGFFTNRLGCERGDVLRAIAPLAGGGPFAFGGCTGQVAAWIEHGDMDTVVNISSGEGSRDFWAGANHCDTGNSTAVSPDPCIAYAGCDEGYPVHWCVSAGGGHEPRPSLTGAGAWSFFQSL